MRRTAEQTRQVILDAAYGLFYTKGYNRTGVDEVALLAGLTKRTLYQHFSSKDDLITAVLARHAELSLARIRKHDERYSGSPADIIGLLFSELARWSAKPGSTGAGFTRIVMELADLPGHPARMIARRHKAALEAWWADHLERAGVADPLDRAREVMLLLEGANALMLIHGDRSYADAACKAATALVCNARPRVDQGNNL